MQKVGEKMSLAERLDKIMFDYDPYSYRDSDLSVEFFEESLAKSPETIIDGLLDTIECLMEACDNYAQELDDRR
jgi:hypothetical protein